MSLANRLIAKHTKRLEEDLEAKKKQFKNPAVAFNVSVWNELIRQAARLELAEHQERTWCHKCCNDTRTYDTDCIDCGLSKPTGMIRGNA